MGIVRLENSLEIQCQIVCVYVTLNGAPDSKNAAESLVYLGATFGEGEGSHFKFALY